MNDQAKELRSLMAENKKEMPEPIRNIKIITIASGKGGVGKSNFSVNLALAMASAGKKPIILDADFGLANVEIILGERPSHHLAHLINNMCTMKQLVTKSKYGISFISGGSGIKEMMFLSPREIELIAERLAELDQMGDTLIIDTGAGINDVVLRFCRLAEEVCIVITPEPTSITDGYALIKTLTKQFGVMTKINIIINKAASKDEAMKVFRQLQTVAENFLGIQVHFGGYIPYDEKLFMAVKQQIPVIIYDERAKSSMAYKQIASSLNTESSEEEKIGWIKRFSSIFKH